MNGYMNASEAAKKFGFCYTDFICLLNDDRVDGAFMWTGIWLIPEDTTAGDIDAPPGWSGMLRNRDHEKRCRKRHEYYLRQKAAKAADRLGA